MRKIILSTFLALFSLLNVFSQETYKIGSTEYYYNQTYSTSGKPMVKRSAENKSKFLKSRGYNSVPPGYEVDHIIPLSEGGTDDPSNMQLLTTEEHAAKTARERGNRSNSTYRSNSNYYSNSTYNISNKSTQTSACGALTKSGSYCNRKVKDGGRCYQHK